MGKLVPNSCNVTVTLAELEEKRRAYRSACIRLGEKIASRASENELSSLRAEFERSEQDFLNARKLFRESDAPISADTAGNAYGRVTPRPTLDETESHIDKGGNYRGRYGYSSDFYPDER